MYTFLSLFSLALIVVSIIVLVCCLLCLLDDGPSKKLFLFTLFSILFLVLSARTFASSEEPEYSSIITNYSIEFVKENPKSRKVTYGYANEQFSFDINDCEIVLVGENIKPSNTLDADIRKIPTLPYYQEVRTVRNYKIKLFGKTIHGKPTIKTTHRFYVPKSYLDNRFDYDWSLLFEEN